MRAESRDRRSGSSATWRIARDWEAGHHASGIHSDSGLKGLTAMRKGTQRSTGGTTLLLDVRENCRARLLNSKLFKQANDGRASQSVRSTLRPEDPAIVLWASGSGACMHALRAGASVGAETRIASAGVRNSQAVSSPRATRYRSPPSISRLVFQSRRRDPSIASETEAIAAISSMGRDGLFARKLLAAELVADVIGEAVVRHDVSLPKDWLAQYR